VVKTKITKRVGFHARNTTLIFFTLKMFYRTAIIGKMIIRNIPKCIIFAIEKIIVK